MKDIFYYMGYAKYLLIIIFIPVMMMSSCFNNLTTNTSKTVGNTVEVDKVNALFFKDLDTAQNFKTKLSEIKTKAGNPVDAGYAEAYYYNKIENEGLLQKKDYVKIISIHGSFLEVEVDVVKSPSKRIVPLKRTHGYIDIKDLKE